MMPPMAEVFRLPLSHWIREGLRAGVLLRPRTGAAQPTPLQVLALVAIWSALELALGRLEVPGEAKFDLRGWLVTWWSTGAVLLLVWWALPVDEPEQPPRGVAAWFALWITAIVPLNCFVQVLTIAQAHGVLPAWPDWRGWVLYILLWAWLLAMSVRLTASFNVPARRNAAVAVALIGVFAIGAWQFPDRTWQGEGEPAAEESRPSLELTQEILETQHRLLQEAVARLAPERAGVVDVYGLVFSPYSEEDVFLRESTMVTKLLEQRFDASSRVVHLANHATTAESLAWATPANLQRAVDAIGEKMDRERDLLFVYMTSHGANDFRLAAANPPLAVEPISPGDLRKALDNAGIRHRVVVISACYSGGWVGPVADDHTLVMTAADANRTSYGCGALSELTFFGRAVFDEQLRRTHSLEQAFAAAVPVIRQRENEAGKDDGFSDPQIHVGTTIRPVLQELERRLAGATAAVPASAASAIPSK